MNSQILQGQVRHRRFSPKKHQFSYPIYMVSFDLDELDLVNQQSRFIGIEQAAWLSFYKKDHFPNAADNNSIKQCVLEQVASLQSQPLAIDQVIYVGQLRCAGFYFSPINFFFCYQQGEHVVTLVEVSNTPWLERHFYLLEQNNACHEKSFHVSPFMEMNQDYQWKIRPPKQTMLVHIENNQHSDNKKVFDATLSLQGQTLSAANIRNLIFKKPLMTLSIVSSIYWQAFKLFFIKRFRFIAHPTPRGSHGTNK